MLESKACVTVPLVNVEEDEMRIGVIGAGNIGGTLARLLAAAGHDVVVSFSTDPARLSALAESIGARTGTPREAAEHGEVVVLSVPWGVVDEALAQAGAPDSLAGRIVVDTTNQFGGVDGRFTVLDLGDRSAAALHARAVPGARWVKAFNTLTAGFQASAAGRTGSDRVVMFYATDDEDAVAPVERLVEDAGFDPVRTGTLARNDVGHQEPKGDLYGEEFHREDAERLVQTLRGTAPSGTGRP
jgi:predicted dinucleotide-binding enzyme